MKENISFVLRDSEEHTITKNKIKSFSSSHSFCHKRNKSKTKYKMMSVKHCSWRAWWWNTILVENNSKVSVDVTTMKHIFSSIKFTRHFIVFLIHFIYYVGFVHQASKETKHIFSPTRTESGQTRRNPRTRLFLFPSSNNSEQFINY